jgi:hypothetical protein
MLSGREISCGNFRSNYKELFAWINGNLCALDGKEDCRRLLFSIRVSTVSYALVARVWTCPTKVPELLLYDITSLNTTDDPTKTPISGQLSSLGFSVEHKLDSAGASPRAKLKIVHKLFKNGIQLVLMNCSSRCLRGGLPVSVHCYVVQDGVKYRLMHIGTRVDGLARPVRPVFYATTGSRGDKSLAEHVVPARLNDAGLLKYNMLYHSGL